MLWSISLLFEETLLYADSIATDKRGYPHNIFLISRRKHMLWYSLEATRRGASNECPQHMFLARRFQRVPTTYVFIEK